jgi:hypothetical protein
MGESREDLMDISRCPQCRRLLVPVLSANGRTELLCLKCDEVDPLRTDAAKWARSPLADDQAA